MKNKKTIFFGIITGFIANAVGFILAILILGGTNTITETITIANREGFLGKLISLGAIVNLFVFFYFIKNREDNCARGVLFVTIFVALVTLVFKFI